MSELSVGLQRKTREVAPLRNLDQKSVLARNQSASSTRTDSRSAIPNSLRNWETSSENGVRIMQAKYKQEDPTMRELSSRD